MCYYTSKRLLKQVIQRFWGAVWERVILLYYDLKNCTFTNPE